MDGEVLAEPAGRGAHAAPLEQQRRHQRSTGNDDGRRPHGQPAPGRKARGDAAGTASFHVDTFHLGSRNELRTALQRFWHVAHVGRALGAGGATEAAHALTVATRRVAPERPVRQLHELRPARDHARRAAEMRRGRLLHAEHGLDPLVVGRERIGRQHAEAVALGPAPECPFRRPVAGAGVDRGAAADGATSPHRRGDVAERNGRASAQVHAAVRRAGSTQELVTAVVFARLEHEHRAAAARQLVGGRSAAGARTDDHHLALEIQILDDVAAGHDLLHEAFGLDAPGRVHTVATADVGEHLRSVEVRGFERRDDGAQEPAHVARRVPAPGVHCG